MTYAKKFHFSNNVSFFFRTFSSAINANRGIDGGRLAFSTLLLSRWAPRLAHDIQIKIKTNSTNRNDTLEHKPWQIVNKIACLQSKLTRSPLFVSHSFFLGKSSIWMVAVVYSRNHCIFSKSFKFSKLKREKFPFYWHCKCQTKRLAKRFVVF